MAGKKTSKSVEIKIALLKHGVKQIDIAERFGVSRQHINNVISGRTHSKNIVEYLKNTLGVAL